MLSDKDLIIRLVTAMVVGAAIGLERQFRNRHAGIRTFSILCMASALTAILGLKAGEFLDKTSIPEILFAVVLGMGFLGAGLIYKEMQKKVIIHGLTTSTTLMMTAVIGVGIGIGYLKASLLSAFLTIFVLIVFRFIEKFFGLKK